MLPAAAHIETQARLRARVTELIAAVWTQSPGYDEANVEPFVTQATALVLAAQRASIALTDAYVARALERAPLGLDVNGILGGLRGGVPPAEVYRRPFVTTWAALGNDVPYQQAVHNGLVRAQGLAATDVQIAMQHTLRAVAERDDRVLGYSRVPDAGACAFCRLVAGQRYRRQDLMPLHPHCGCGVDVITAENRAAFTGNAANDLDGVVVAEHGELGPVLVDPAHTFTEL